jgi:hypothetical protein
VTFTAFYQDIPALSIWWLSPFHLTFSPPLIDRRGKVVTSGRPGEVFAKAREIAAE